MVDIPPRMRTPSSRPNSRHRKSHRPPPEYVKLTKVYKKSCHSKKLVNILGFCITERTIVTIFHAYLVLCFHIRKSIVYSKMCSEA